MGKHGFNINDSIKDSLSKRLDASRTFILSDGNSTKTVRSERYQYCKNYKTYTYTCVHRYSVNYRSYIEHEFGKAVRDGLRIMVLYNAATVNKTKCPHLIKKVGTHVAMCCYGNGQYYWDYQTVKNVIG